jgi:hypothetical protein
MARGSFGAVRRSFARTARPSASRDSRSGHCRRLRPAMLAFLGVARAREDVVHAPKPTTFFAAIPGHSEHLPDTGARAPIGKCSGERERSGRGGEVAPWFRPLRGFTVAASPLGLGGPFGRACGGSSPWREASVSTGVLAPQSRPLGSPPSGRATGRVTRARRTGELDPFRSVDREHRLSARFCSKQHPANPGNVTG